MGRGDDSDNVIPFRGKDGGRYDGRQEYPAYHEAHEEWDTTRRVVIGRNDYGTCRIRIVNPLWADRAEEFAYQVAVESNPQGDTEGSLAYAQRVSEIATAKMAGRLVEPMPRTRMTRRETDAQLQKLREQAARLPAGEKDDESPF